jgi:hypothetical protein
MKISSATFDERRNDLLRRSMSDRVVRPGGSAHVPSDAEHEAATQRVTEQMLDEIHAMLRVLTSR